MVQELQFRGDVVIYCDGTLLFIGFFYGNFKHLGWVAAFVIFIIQGKRDLKGGGKRWQRNQMKQSLIYYSQFNVSSLTYFQYIIKYKSSCFLLTINLFSFCIYFVIIYNFPINFEIIVFMIFIFFLVLFITIKKYGVIRWLLGVLFDVVYAKT